MHVVMPPTFERRTSASRLPCWEELVGTAAKSEVAGVPSETPPCWRNVECTLDRVLLAELLELETDGIAVRWPAGLLRGGGLVRSEFTSL